MSGDETLACHLLIRCADRTLCPPDCQKVGTREDPDLFKIPGLMNPRSLQWATHCNRCETGTVRLGHGSRTTMRRVMSLYEAVCDKCKEASE